MPNIKKTSQQTGSRASNTSRQRRSENPSRYALPLVESLESRQLLAATTLPAALWRPTDSNLYDAQNGPMASFGTSLVSIYQAYETAATTSSGVNSATLASQFPSVEFNNGLVGMDINSLGGDFNAFLTQLTNLGMQVTASSSAYGIAEGWVPISELPTIATLPQTEAGSPILTPTLSSFQGFQGQAYNEPETALGADSVRSTTGLTGAGVTVGVLSDSVNESNGGLAESYGTGDLDPNNPVTVIQDDPYSGGEDEGRAMLESVHDIAPGAKLQFATAFSGELGFMQNIEALYAAGSKIIADDVNYSDEPMFQDGLVAQGVDYVTSRGDEYFSSATNLGTDNGYLSTMRAVSTTVNGISGTWDNFSPSGSSNFLLPVTALTRNASITFEYDQPYKTQEPAGATASVTSNVDFYVFNSAGQIVASGTDNNVATQAPYQSVTIPFAGNYYVGIDVVSGTAPGHVEFRGVGGSAQIAVSQQYGATGGTYYPSTYGHNASAATIGVAAMPWWAASPFLAQSPLQAETFSSSGPNLIDLSPKGTPMTTQLILNPSITAPDGGSNTAFEGGNGAGVDTADPYFGPATPYNFNPSSQADFNSFFGTSQAAPDAAAVAALMLQDVPTLSRVQILQTLEQTATAMNGTAAGTWNLQSGYGLVNAVAAINALTPSPLIPTTVTVTPLSSTATVANPYNLSITVTGAGGTPSGSVNVYDVSYDISLATANLNNGHIQVATTPYASGAHVYLVTYSGSATYAPSTAYVVFNALATSSAIQPSSIVLSQSAASQQYTNAIVVGLTSIAANKNNSQTTISTS